MARTRWVLVFVGLAVVVSACGGGGGGGGGGAVPFSASSFFGTYWLILFEPESSGGGGSATWGTAVSDGVSVVTLNGSENNNGTVGTPGTQMLDYTVGPDGTLSLFQTGTTTDLVQGGISADGNCIVMSSASTSVNPVLIVLIRTAGIFSAASLTGDFHMSAYSTSGGASKSLFSTKPTFDGVSGYAGTGESNEDGVLDGGPISDNYTVATNGQATVDLFADTHEGCLLAGGNFGAFAGGNTTGDDPGTVLLMRAGTAATTGTLAGSYWIIGIERNLGSGDYESIYGTVVADGVGGITITGSSNNGTAIVPVVGTAVYSVALDGTLVVDRSGVFGNEDLTGAVSIDGRMAMIGGGSVLGSRPVLYVLCRK